MVKVIVGLMGSSVANGSAHLSTTSQLSAFLSTCLAHNVRELDTARVYNAGQSETQLGETPEKTSFKLETKAPGFSPGSLSKEKILSNAALSLSALQTKKIDLYYFHGPDRSTPLEESCGAIAELHAAGKIAAFGLSNFRADEVESVVRICEQKGWIKPSVYQGGYNPLARGAEEQLFPTLRKFGMKFYAYSPLAGGFFSRSVEQLRQPPKGGRMDKMPVFSSMYVTDDTLKLHGKLQEVCAKEGTTMKEATLRWIMHHSILGDEDGVVLGASSNEQLEENLSATEKGPLSAAVVDVFEELWQVHKEKNSAYSV